MTKPYYEDDFVTLYHGDALELAPLLGGDVLVTDPPYGTAGAFADGTPMGYGRRTKHNPTGRTSAMIANDTDTGTRDAILALYADAPTIVFGSPRQPEPPGQWDDRLIWNKTRPGINGGPVRYQHENIYARGMVRANNHTFSILTAHPDQRDHIHAKPVSIMEVLLSICPPGVIVDPFAGSGSTLLAAKRLGRKAIGIELEERYCELTATRLAQDALAFDTPTATMEPLPLT